MKFNRISNYKIYHLRINDQILDSLEKYKKNYRLTILQYLYKIQIN